MLANVCARGRRGRLLAGINSFMMSRVLGAICARSASSGAAKLVIHASEEEKKDSKLPSPPENAR